MAHFLASVTDNSGVINKSFRVTADSEMDAYYVLIKQLSFPGHTDLALNIAIFPWNADKAPKEFTDIA